MVVLGWIIAGLLTLCYSWYVLSCARVWRLDQLPPEITPSQPITIIVVARDEASNIERCLTSIWANHLSVPELRIILVDDHSTDDTVAIAERLDIPALTILHLSDSPSLDRYGHSYKKAAIDYSLSRTDTELVMTTDADCWMSDQWVSSAIHQLISTESRALTGPVRMQGDTDSLLTAWQQMDLCGTMAGTHLGLQRGWYQTANAANMIYYRDDYQRYLCESIHANASGDDVFFFQQMAARGERIGYMCYEQSIVSTAAESSWTDLIRQRIRWATKTTSYPSIATIALMGSLFLFHLVMIALIVGGLWSTGLLCAGLTMLVAKVIVEYILLSRVTSSFGIKMNGLRHPLQVLMHSIYIAWIGFTGLVIRRYRWKGREVS